MAEEGHPLEWDFSLKRADGGEKKVAHVSIDGKVDWLITHMCVRYAMEARLWNSVREGRRTGKADGSRPLSIAIWAGLGVWLGACGLIWVLFLCRELDFAFTAS